MPRIMEINLAKVAMNVRVARAKENLTINELAKRSGVGATTISFVENAKKEVRLGTLEKIAKALNKSLEDLISE